MLVSLAWKTASFVCAKRSSKAGSDSHCWWPARTSMAALLALALSLCNSLFLCLSVGHLALLGLLCGPPSTIRWSDLQLKDITEQ